MTARSEEPARAKALEVGGERAVGLVDELLGKRLDRRGFLVRAGALGLSASAAGALLAACGSSAPVAASTTTRPSKQQATPPPTKTLSWRSLADVQNVDPAILPGLEDPTLAIVFFEGLITYKPGSGEAVNCLAESFEQSKDGLQLHFTLKQGMPWQKGYGEVRASDVKYSYERIAGLTKPKFNSPYQGDWAALDQVRVDSKYSGTIMMKEVFAPTMTSTLRNGSGLVLPEKAVEKLGKRFGTNPVGSGPFEWASWTPGQKLVMTRFADYGGANKAYASKNSFEQIDMLPIQSDDSAYAALESNEVNFCEMGTSTVKQAKSNPELKVTSFFSGNYYWLAMNVTEPPLTNVWLRRAIRSAIDVPGIIKDAYSGFYSPSNSIIPKQMPIGYWPEAPVYQQDISLAKSYLARSGLTNVTLKLNCESDQDDTAAAEIITANLGQIGIKVNVEPVDAATFNNIPGPGGGGAHPQLIYDFYAGAGDPNLWFEWWTCSQVGLWNWDHWCNHQFSKLLDEALHTYDVTERTKLYVEAQKLWDTEAGMAWICTSNGFVATAKYVDISLDPGTNNFVIWNTTYT
ncbi:MAG: ABC transporter substrate-binding protein [Acidimicrobiales bacterium]